MLTCDEEATKKVSLQTIVAKSCFRSYQDDKKEVNDKKQEEGMTKSEYNT